MSIRQPIAAGRFYPAAPEDLRHNIQAFLDAGIARHPQPAAPLHPVALMLPHAGHVYCGHVISATLASVILPQTLILLCPNHTGMGRPLAVWPEGAWQTPLGQVPVDSGMVDALCSAASSFQRDELAHWQEHALEVILPFLQVSQRQEFHVIPICVGTREPQLLAEAGRELARVLRALPAGEDDLPVGIIISSDMNHYEDARITEQKDRMALAHVLACDQEGLLRTTGHEHISMCGAAPLALALHALRHLTGKHPPRAELVLHDTSGSISGDMTHVVGYAGVHFFLP